MNLTQHFTLEEFTRSDTAARLGIDNKPGLKARMNLEKLAEALEHLRKFFQQPIIISSGFRCAELNLATPGSSAQSAHMLGFAVDFHVQGWTPQETCTQVVASCVPFDQLILEYGSWCHFSIDPRSRGMVLTKSLGQPIKEGLWP